MNPGARASKQQSTPNRWAPTHSNAGFEDARADGWGASLPDRGIDFCSCSPQLGAVIKYKWR